MRSALVIALFATALAGGVLGLSSCLSKPRFECANMGDCASSSGPGVCEPDGFCSFMDSVCPSGRRYGDLSGPQANQCVGVPPDAPPPPDAAPDSYVHDARECFGGGAYQLCFTAMPPMGDVNLAGALGTTTDVRCQPTMPQSWIDAGQPDSCLIMGKTITVSAAVTVTGTRPLVLLAETIAVNALIDLASHRAMASGPGAPASQCAAFGSTPVSDATGGAGGAGGTFMRAGGNGGRGNGAAVLGGIAAPADTVAPTVLRAGCAGQVGGAAGVVMAGAPGQGGGAIYLTASRILISGNGAINASGAGALGGGSLTGGSGGGTGGMVVLHAAESIAATGGRLVANGGGGSGGAEAGVGANVNGLPGADPIPANQSVPAAGGNGPGGVGGNGFAGTAEAQNGANAVGNNETGGGGGGGAGYLQSNRAIIGALVSPPVTVVP